jgi:hypothetical protein
MGSSVAPMELPEPDPSKLLQAWMEWERGEVTPGRVMANLKTGGMRQLLEGLTAEGQPSPASQAPDRPADGADKPGEQQGSQTASWSPVV